MSVSGALVLVHVENLDFHKCARFCPVHMVTGRFIHRCLPPQSMARVLLFEAGGSLRLAHMRMKHVPCSAFLFGTRVRFYSAHYLIRV